MAKLAELESQVEEMKHEREELKEAYTKLETEQRAKADDEEAEQAVAAMSLKVSESYVEELHVQN